MSVRLKVAFKHCLMLPVWTLKCSITTLSVELFEVIKEDRVGWVGVRTAPTDTLQGVTPEGKKIFVCKFTKNSGETRSDR